MFSLLPIQPKYTLAQSLDSKETMSNLETEGEIDEEEYSPVEDEGQKNN